MLTDSVSTRSDPSQSPVLAAVDAHRSVQHRLHSLVSSLQGVVNRVIGAPPPPTASSVGEAARPERPGLVGALLDIKDTSQTELDHLEQLIGQLETYF